MDAKEEIAIVPIEAPTTPPPNLMDKEENTQLEAPKESEITEITDENKTLKTKDQEEEDNAITETGTVKNIDVAVEEISGAEAVEDQSMKEEIKEAVIAVNNATEQTAETTELVKEEAKDQSDDVVPISVALVSETSETETTELAKEEAKDQSDDGAPISSAVVSETGETEATELVKEEAKDQSDDVVPISVALVSETSVTETTELVKEEAKDQSDVTPVSATLVSETGVASVTPNPEEQKQTEDLTTPVAETHEENKQGAEELVKEEIKETDSPNHATDTETIIDKAKDAKPNHEEENKVIEIVNESPNLQQEAKLPEVESEDLKLQDTLVAATVGEEEEAKNKDELVKEVIKESELPDSSVAVTPVVDTTELTPETKTTDTDTGAVTEEVHTEKEKANSDELKVEINTDVSPGLAESADAVESEVTQVLPEKKKKRPLGDHLAEEKANDSSVTANKQVSDDKSEVEPSEVEQTATAVAPKESTEISPRDANITHDTQSESGQKKEEDEKVTREVTTTESAQEGEGEKVAEKESAPTGEAAKEKVASKLTSRSSNNLLSKVKHQIVKVKKAIVRKSPSSKNMPVENKDDIKVK